tara:strand:- start:768 stop:962 length:195 start_codon:yes stop_codon:yes gene_type:complete
MKKLILPFLLLVLFSSCESFGTAPVYELHDDLIINNRTGEIYFWKGKEVSKLVSKEDLLDAKKQ